MNTQVIEFLTANPNSNKAAITEVTGIKGLPLFNLIKQMLKDSQITSTGEGNDATYSLTGPKTEDVVKEEQTSSEETPQSDAIIEDNNLSVEPIEQKNGVDLLETKEQTEEITKVMTPRNNDKFKFNGEEMGKGALVRSVISKFVADDQGMTYTKLLETFPATLLKRFGVVEEIEKAREISGTKYDRYFFKDEHQIRLKGKIVVVCNQWTSDNIQPFLKIARELGYVIE